MNDKISKEKIQKYFDLTGYGLKEVKKNIAKGREKEAEEIIEMAENYLSDAEHFFKKGNWVDAFAALNYSHGWIDCGVRLGIFDVSDDKLFTIR